MKVQFQRYLQAINQASKKQKINLSEILEILDDITMKQLKKDLLSLDIAINANTIDSNKAKWKLRNFLISHKNDENNIRIEDSTVSQIDVELKNLLRGSASEALLRERSFQIMKEYPNDTLLSLSLLPDKCVAYKHQIQGVNELFGSFHSRAILADEVGLGKTITALLWLHEHILRSRKELAALILVPGNLMKQWCDAFFDFFRIIFNSKPNYSIAQLEMQDILLLPLDQAKMGDKAKVLKKRYWDCLILDESHDIKNNSSIRFKFIYSINATYKLFLSATPIQNTAYDLHSQSMPLLPGLLDTSKQFGEYYLTDEKRVTNPEGLRKLLNKLLIRKRRDDIPFQFSHRIYHTERIEEWTEYEFTLYNDLLAILIGVFHKQLPKAVIIARQSGSEIAVADFVLTCMLLLREMASHPDAALETIKKSFYPKILEFANATKDYSFTESLNAFIDKYNEKKHHLSKQNYLLNLLFDLFQRPERRVIIYVTFLKTRDAIEKIIESKIENVDIMLYYGELSKSKKEAVVTSFFKSSRAVLISTDSGGQGLNLDAADVVINYDYPWNPMKVEQRIGRIDRIRRRYNNIYIYNLITSGTIEQYVYQTLIEKINIVQDVFGDIMSPIEVKEEWERRFMVSIGMIVLSCSNSSELKEKFEKLDKTSLSRAETQYRTLIYDRYKNVLE